MGVAVQGMNLEDEHAVKGLLPALCPQKLWVQRVLGRGKLW